MTWTVEFEKAFEAEFEALQATVQDAIFARLILLQREGPSLGRPHADTLTGSRHANMKELRVNAADGVWRVAFAFDPERKAILLAAGDKSGGSEKRFYKTLITKADKRYQAHLDRLAAAKKGKK